MKRPLSLLLTALLLAGTVLSAVSCGGRVKKDLSSAASLADLAGAAISAQSGTFHERARGQIENVSGAIYPDFDSMLIALRAGTIDGYLAEEPTAFVNCEKYDDIAYVKLVNNTTGFRVGDLDTAISIGCRKGSDLTARINEVLATLTTESKNALMNECFTACVSKDREVINRYSVAAEEPTAPVGVLRVAMECAYDPFNWSQTTAANGAVPIYGESGTGLYANGYDVQIARYVAAKLNMALEIYAVPWDSLIPGVQSGLYDAIVAGMSPTEERLLEIDFTDPYYNSNLVVIYCVKE